MRILLTNDDGINAPGLKVLEEIAATLSDDVWVCAPAEEQSGAGHSLTLSRPVRLRRHSERRWSASGTPTDAVMLAMKKVLPGAPDHAAVRHALSLVSDSLDSWRTRQYDYYQFVLNKIM